MAGDGTAVLASSHRTPRVCTSSSRAGTYNAGMQPATESRRSGIDAQLVRAAAAGNRDAMERLLIGAQEVAYRFSLLICGHTEDAEDVMQDALLKTYQHVNQIADPEAFRTWLYSTVRNACLMKRRRRVGEPARMVSLDHGLRSDNGSAVELDIADSARTPDEQLQQAWAGQQLQAALQSLPAIYRAVIVLREIEGLTTREVAQVTGLSEANVKQRLHRARVTLRRTLEAS